MNLGTHIKSVIVVVAPGLNSNVLFCVVKISSIYKEGSIWTPPLRTRAGNSRVYEWVEPNPRIMRFSLLS